jgi:hypothetical protein
VSDVVASLVLVEVLLVFPLVVVATSGIIEEVVEVKKIVDEVVEVKEMVDEVIELTIAPGVYGRS